MDCRLQVFSLESGQFMATSSWADISEIEHFFWIFIAFLKSTLNLGCFEEKDQSESLSVKEIINCERGSCLNAQKGIFHATLRKTTCQRVPNTAGTSTEPVSIHSSINL